MKTNDHQPTWVAITVAIIMSILGPVIVWGITTRSAQSQKEDASALAQEVSNMADRVNQVRLTVQAISTVSPSTPIPFESADIKKLNAQISELEQQIAAINARPSPTPLPGPIASSSDLDALKARVADLQKMIEQRPTPAPMTIPTVLAHEGIPIDSKLPLISARASSTDNQIDANEKPIYKPELAIDSEDTTFWVANEADREKAWIEISLDTVRTITGIRFLAVRGYPSVFRDATLIFSDGTAQDLHLTQAQLGLAGWQYFPLVTTQANQIRIVMRSLNQGRVAFAEIEVYGR